MMEKYLNDTLRAERVKEVERIANADLMPGWLPRVQFVEDSIRARYWFNLTKDSNYLRKYLKRGMNPRPVKKDSLPEKKIVLQKTEILLPDNKFLVKKKLTNT